MYSCATRVLGAGLCKNYSKILADSISFILALTFLTVWNYGACQPSGTPRSLSGTWYYDSLNK